MDSFGGSGDNVWRRLTSCAPWHVTRRAIPGPTIRVGGGVRGECCRGETCCRVYVRVHQSDQRPTTWGVCAQQRVGCAPWLVAHSPAVRGACLKHGVCARAPCGRPCDASVLCAASFAEDEVWLTGAIIIILVVHRRLVRFSSVILLGSTILVD